MATPAPADPRRLEAMSLVSDVFRLDADEEDKDMFMRLLAAFVDARRPARNSARRPAAAVIRLGERRQPRKERER